MPTGGASEHAFWPVPKELSAPETFVAVDEPIQVAILLQDFQAAHELLDAGALDPYQGQFVAVLRGQVVGAGPSEEELRARVSQEHNVHPERVVLTHVAAGQALL